MSKTKKILKNVSDQTQVLIGVGVVKPGETVEVDASVNNPNFEEVKKKASKKTGRGSSK